MTALPVSDLKPLSQRPTNRAFLLLDRFWHTQERLCLFAEHVLHVAKI